MRNPGLAVRAAAESFHKALADAKATGLAVTWPLTVDGLLSISISETGRATVTNLDGSAIERGADGIILGQLLNMTDEERAALPVLDALTSDKPAAFGYADAPQSDAASAKPPRPRR